MNYKIFVPKPSASRLEKDRSLMIVLNNSHGNFFHEMHKIPEEANVFEFSFDKPLSQENEETDDGSFYFDFFVVFKNNTGSRIEKTKVEPIQI